MELTLDLKKQYTYADYLTWLDDKRRELVDGFIRMMSPSSTATHQRISVNMTIKLGNYINRKNGNCKIFVAPFDVRLPKNGEISDDKIDTVVQPDIFIVCDPAKIEERGCIGAPDMIVEIQSPSTASYDRKIKYKLYEQAGVREYWIVKQKGGVNVFILQPDGKYGEPVSYRKHETVQVHVLPGCEIKLKDIYK